MDETHARILPFDRRASPAPNPPEPVAVAGAAAAEAERLRYWAQLGRLRAERRRLAG